MNSTPSRQRSGFTLIELLAVIVILGILAVASLPRLFDLQEHAYHASLQATAGAFGSAVQLATLACRIKDGTGASDLPGYGDGDMDFNANCFPVATSGNGNNGNGNGNGNGNNGNANGNNGNGNGNGNSGNGNGNGGSAALTGEGCAAIWNRILASAPSVSGASGSDYRASASGTACTYTLQLDRRATRSFSYDSATGAVAVISNP